MTQRAKTYWLMFFSALPFTVMRNVFQYSSYFGDEILVFLTTWVVHYAGLTVISIISCLVMESWQGVFINKREGFKINNQIANYCVACITIVASICALFIHSWGLYHYGS